ncbi:uncharacterized protein TNCT_574981 [Trichonephila clavata]|uniref:Uncharacterized protein n=1 Tax=Trichonephila clavata TaxID=2740835 RepID=A0A8X6K886_TRICU|nr:uncharacterized protein TNCT_574981 [Trichonephila clavata]
MHEYEFRYVVQDTTPFHLQVIFPECTVQVQHVWYVKPHFRYKNKRLETKHIVSTEAVFYDGLWFKWVHSIETPHISWSSLTHKIFLDAAGSFQCPFRNETRHVWTLDNQAQVYTFAHPDGTYRLVFEWEYGVFSKPIKKFDTELLLENLGNIGKLYSFPEYIKEKWEGGIHKIHKGISLGDGIVFSAEKLSNGTVVLLDVYQVRGFPTVQWNREIVLINFLQHLSLPEGYETQKYCHRVEDLPMTRYETDGYIIHNTKTDKIVKVKHTHSLDVVYMDGFFWLPGKEKPGLYRRFKALEKGLQNGHVYEVSVKNGNVLRERKDRFIGNTWKQIENILEKQSWQGPTIHEVVKVIKTTKRKCKSKAT